MSNSSQTEEGFVRTERREQAHAGVVRRALAFAVITHLILAVAINPSVILRLLKPDVPLGYPGEPHKGELAPLGPEGKDRFTFFRVRRYTGPVTLKNYEPVASGPTGKAASAGQGQPVVGNIGESGPVERNVRGRSGGTGGPLVIELGEDWAVVQKTGAIAQSDKFQAEKIVRPEYPMSAIRRGVEGLIRLRVEVDTAGTVIDVDTIENTAGDSTLEQASVRAMVLWKFRPYRLRSRPVPFTLIVPFRYTLVD